MRPRILRVQDAEGRGPYRPGFSAVWCDSFGPPPPMTWLEEFPHLGRRVRRLQREYGGAHFGCGCRTEQQIHTWFTPTERYRLAKLGFQLVAMHVDRILAESPTQLVFLRERPLTEGIEVLPLSDLRAVSADKHTRESA